MFPVFFNTRNKEVFEVPLRDHIAFGVVADHTGKFAVVGAVISVGVLALNLQFPAERSLFRGNDLEIKSFPWCIFMNFAIAAFPYSVFRRFIAPPGKERFKVIAKNIYRVFLFLLAISFGVKALMDILNTFLCFFNDSMRVIIALHRFLTADETEILQYFAFASFFFYRIPRQKFQIGI